MAPFLGYQCSVCGQQYGPDDLEYTCPADGGNVDVLLDYERLRRTLEPHHLPLKEERSIWRYTPLLPVDEPGHRETPLWAVGWTPLFKLPSVEARRSAPAVWLKDDGRNPTASFKDRASAVVVTRAQEVGAGVIVTASTGNAGAALAGMAAAARVPAVILAPESAPPAKIAQLLIFGAVVVLVTGTYDDAFDLTLQAAAEFGWYCRNTGYNPFTAEGKKTAAFEICEQYSQVQGTGLEKGIWRTPDAVFVSVGDGNIISGLHKGFKDLHQLGWIERIPRLYGVQSTGSAAIYNAFATGEEIIRPVRAQTLADSISVDLPRDGLRALRAATQTDGAYIAVRDEEILAAMVKMGRDAAVFSEPAGAAAYAGFMRAVELELLRDVENVVVLNTGNGLKDVRAAKQAAGEATVIKPELSALREAMRASALADRVG